MENIRGNYVVRPGKTPLLVIPGSEPISSAGGGYS